MNTTTAINEAIEVILNFQRSPMAYIDQLNRAKNISSQCVVKDLEYINLSIQGIAKEAITNVEILCSNLDKQNQSIVAEIPLRFKSSEADYSLILNPIERVGIYIPYRLPSSALTYLSMAHVVGVKDVVVYLAQDDTGHPDPLSVYVCKRYGADIWAGPARTGFPSLAFGLDHSHPKVDLICGPCGNRLNLIKNLSALISGCGIDMSAGASDLCIVSNSSSKWYQILLDLSSQLEHGADSTACLIIVGNECRSSFLTNPYAEKLISNEKIKIYYCSFLEEAARIVDEIAPESLEVIMDDHERFIPMISNYGVGYINTSSTLGDYAVVGRGCSDPTNGMAKSQSGISPFTFLKVRPIVHPAVIDKNLLGSAQFISGYEELENHKRVIEYYLQRI